VNHLRILTGSTVRSGTVIRAGTIVEEGVVLEDGVVCEDGVILGAEPASDYAGCAACLREDRVPTSSETSVSLSLAPGLAAQLQEKLATYLGQLNTEIARRSLESHLNSLVRGWMENGRYAFVLDHRSVPQDPLHPRGKCTCTGEGRCAWCLLDCNAQQDEKECGECRECLGAKLRHAEAVASAAMERTGAAEADCARWAARVKELERRLDAIRRTTEGGR